ncbi:hypothetical protein HDU98_009826 [Podochytrium sp. JEL0797]|nr:hypothetical protein HDU98_009826 [Podochytrium sp. JEL0797]
MTGLKSVMTSAKAGSANLASLGFKIKIVERLLYTAELTAAATASVIPPSVAPATEIVGAPPSPRAAPPPPKVAPQTAAPKPVRPSAPSASAPPAKKLKLDSPLNKSMEIVNQAVPVKLPGNVNVDDVRQFSSKLQGLKNLIKQQTQGAPAAPVPQAKRASGGSVPPAQNMPSQQQQQQRIQPQPASTSTQQQQTITQPLPTSSLPPSTSSAAPQPRAQQYSAQPQPAIPQPAVNVRLPPPQPHPAQVNPLESRQSQPPPPLYATSQHAPQAVAPGYASNQAPPAAYYNGRNQSGYYEARGVSPPQGNGQGYNIPPGQQMNAEQLMRQQQQVLAQQQQMRIQQQQMIRQQQQQQAQRHAEQQQQAQRHAEQQQQMRQQQQPRQAIQSREQQQYAAANSASAVSTVDPICWFCGTPGHVSEACHKVRDETIDNTVLDYLDAFLESKKLKVPRYQQLRALVVAKLAAKKDRARQQAIRMAMSL